MTKGDLVSSIAENANLTKEQASDALNATLNAISNAMKNGDKAAILGFGTFSVSHRKARKGINPATKQPIDIAAKNVVKFKAGKGLSEVVN